MTTRKAKASASWLVDGLHPTLRDETAKDGAPVRLGLAEMGLRRQEIPFDSLVGLGLKNVVGWVRVYIPPIPEAGWMGHPGLVLGVKTTLRTILSVGISTGRSGL